jgi:hypothetical protein
MIAGLFAELMKLCSDKSKNKKCYNLIRINRAAAKLAPEQNSAVT